MGTPAACHLCFLFQIIFQFFAAAGMTQFTQGFCLDLTDSFSCDIEFFAHFFQCSGTSVVQTKAQAQYLFFPFGEGIQHFDKLFFQQGKCCRFRRGGNIVIGDKVTQMAVFFFADGSFQRNRFLCDFHGASAFPLPVLLRSVHGLIPEAAVWRYE